MKICKKCGIEKQKILFSLDSRNKSNVRGTCKACAVKNSQEYYINNKDKVDLYRSQYEKTRATRTVSKEKKREYHKNYKDKMGKEFNGAWMSKYRSDPIFAMKCRIRRSINQCLSSKGICKVGLIQNVRTFDILGCNYDSLKAHIERQFSEGMTWGNRELWHIDHKIPLALAKDELDVFRLNHYTNLQPLWAIDNLTKGAKY